MGRESQDNDKTEYSFKELADKLASARVSLSDAQAAEHDATEALRLHLAQKQGEVLPLKGQTFYKRVNVNGAWRKIPWEETVPPEEYVVMDLHMDGYWIVDVTKPVAQDYVRFGIPLSMLEFATSEEISAHREEYERIHAQARAASGLSVATSSTTVRSDTPF